MRAPWPARRQPAWLPGRYNRRGAGRGRSSRSLPPHSFYNCAERRVLGPCACTVWGFASASSRLLLPNPQPRATSTLGRTGLVQCSPSLSTAAKTAVAPSQDEACYGGRINCPCEAGSCNSLGWLKLALSWTLDSPWDKYKLCQKCQEQISYRWCNYKTLYSWVHGIEIVALAMLNSR